MNEWQKIDSCRAYSRSKAESSAQSIDWDAVNGYLCIDDSAE